MKEYTIVRTGEDVPLDDSVSGSPWAQASEFRLEEFCWSDGGPKPLTTGRALYDDRAIYLQFHVEDDSISATVTERNGPTFQDSSVEFFADPNPGSDTDPETDTDTGTDTKPMYFNFEPNCCGQFKLAWQEDDWEARGIGRELISPEPAARVEIQTSVPGPTKDPSPDDDRWWLTASIPFDVLGELTGLEVEPTSGTEWRGNFYRSGLPDPQKGVWNPIDTPEPDYHSPEFFGTIYFE